MNASKRTLYTLLIASLILTGATGLLSHGQLAAEETANTPLIYSSQMPRSQEFALGGTANFDVNITNIGPVTLNGVSASSTTAPDCDRDSLGSLAPGQTTSYECQKFLNFDAGGHLNVVQVTGTASGSSDTHFSTAFYDVNGIGDSGLVLLKEPEIQTVKMGGTAQFTVTLLNATGSEMKQIIIDDQLFNDCDREFTGSYSLPPGADIEYDCSFANVQSPMVSIINAEGKVGPQTLVDSDATWVELLALTAGITAQPASIPEPGALISFTVNLVNGGSVPVTLTSLTTAQYGNLLDPNNPEIDADTNSCLQLVSSPNIPQTGGMKSCQFSALVSGQPSGFGVNLTAVAKDIEDTSVTATASTSVTISDLPSSISLTLTANPPFINPPSSPVDFGVLVQNTSEADAVTLTGLTDEFLGNLDGKGSCELPVASIPPGQSYQCEFTASVSGQAGQTKSRTVTAAAMDDDIPPKAVNDTETVNVEITDQPATLLFMPNVADDTVEPNDSCSRAYPLIADKQYAFKLPGVYPSDADYFTFLLTQSSQVSVVLTNFTPIYGQLIVRRGDDCSIFVGSNGAPALNRVLALNGPQPPGLYYVQVINDCKPSQQDCTIPHFYGLFVNVD